MTPRLKRILGSLSRHGLAAAGVYLASKGIPPEALELVRDDLARLAGAAVASGAAAWSLSRSATPDTTPGDTEPFRPEKG